MKLGVAVPIIKNIRDAGHIEIDYKEKLLFVGTFFGTLIRVDLNRAIMLGFPSISSSTSSSSSECASSSSSSTTTTSLPASSSFVQVGPISLPDNLYGIKNITTWVDILFAAPTSCRSRSFSILPTYYQSFQPVGGHVLGSYSRAILLDTNSESIYLVDNEGFLNKNVDLGSSFGRYAVQWPSTIASYVKSFDIPAASGGSKAEIVIVVYVGEYLGKIRKFELKESIALRPKVRDVTLSGFPSTLVDRSSYPVSTELRRLLTSAQNEGEMSNRKIAFEIVY